MLVSSATGGWAQTVPPGRGAVGKVRAIHFVIRRVSVDHAKWIVDRAKEGGFNTVIAVVTNGARLPRAPWTPLPEAWSPEEFADWVAYVAAAGMRLVPEIKLLTHQHEFLQASRPDLLFNAETYDPRKEEVYSIVEDVIATVLDITHASAIHIGHDELSRGGNGGAGANPSWLSADLFLRDVLRLHDFLKSRNVETWMWGDMLISPDEFPGMVASQLHGDKPGYGRDLRQKLPHDIVMCDWHYSNPTSRFPSLETFHQEGFRVLGATWKNMGTARSFGSYAAEHGGDGMIATTWFHVGRGEWDLVGRIIAESGRAFREALP